MQILVFGMHRSGTSIIARVINMMGVYFGDEGHFMEAQIDNPKGFWERKDVFRLNDQILSAANATWDNISNLNLSAIEESEKHELIRSAKNIFLAMDSHRPWFIKDPRLCLTYPFISSILELPVGVLVYRNPLEVAMSLKERNGLPLSVGMALWEYYYVQLLNHCRKDIVHICNHDEFIATPYEATARLYGSLIHSGVAGIRMPQKREIFGFIDQALYRQRVEVKNDLNEIGDEYTRLMQYLMGNSLERIPKYLTISERSLGVLKEYSSTCDPLNYGPENSEVENMSTRSITEGMSNNKVLSIQSNSFIDNLDKTRTPIERGGSNVNNLSNRCAAEVTIKNLRSDLNALAQELAREREKNSVLEEFAEMASALERKQCEKLEKLEKDLSLYVNWIALLKTDLDLLFRTYRWRVGSSIAFVFDICRFRFKNNSVRDHIDQIMNEFSSRSIEINKIEKNVFGNKPENIDTNIKLLFKLIYVAIKNPVKTVTLLDLQRLKNLYVTLVSSSNQQQKCVFDYYFDIYKNENALIFEWKERKSEIESNVESLVIPSFNKITVSIIIPVFNKWDYTRRCIQSIILSDTDLKYEIILADDASTDDTLHAEKIFPGIKHIRSQNNRGFLINCNEAAMHATGAFIVFLNNDTVVHNGWLDSLIEVMEDESVGLTGSKLIFDDGRLQEAGGIVWSDGSGWNYGRLDDPARPEYSFIRDVDYISGASIMIRSELWREIGGFDERYAPAYYEDTDLAFEVRSRGYRVVFTPFSIVTHFEGVSHGTDEDSGVKNYQIINREKFVDKWSDVLSTEHYSNGSAVFLARQRLKTGFNKTILVVDHYVPHYDKDAGSRCTYQYLMWFKSKGFNIKFLGDNFFRHEPYTNDLQKNGIEVLYGEYYANNWKKWLEENGEFIDYAYLNRPHIAPKYISILRKYTKSKIVYFGHDLHYLRKLRQFETEGDNRHLLESEKWKKDESDIFEKVDVIYYPSIVEENEVRRDFPGKRVSAIPLNIYDKVEVKSMNYERRTGLMFIGGFRHEPNIDGVIWFVEQVMPLVLEKLPKAIFYIIGSNAPKEIEKMNSNNIKVVGEVSDSELNFYYDKCRISVAPLRYGAGIKGKVVEALKCQIPVVTTDIGAEGLPKPVDYLRVANESTEFAEAIYEIYEDRRKWERLVINGVNCINKNFSVSAVDEVLCKDFDL